MATVESRDTAAIPVQGIAGTGSTESVLSPKLLARFQQRAPTYDRENRFFDEDFDELRGAGYLTIAVPKELGGRGYSLAQVCAEQRRLGHYAAPTAREWAPRY